MIGRRILRRQHILVVDDHRPLLAGIRDILEMEGYTVFTATDGVQALQVMEEKACPDLIISDVMMPRMDGYALLEAVRTRPEWMSIPFIFLTAEAEAKTIGADDYIAKPFNSQALVAVVRTWLERV